VPPQRKKKDVPGALYQQVLDGIPRVVPPETPVEGEQAALEQPEPEPESIGVAAGAEGEHEGPVHRRLIRATLPKLPGAEPPVRREPEFTIRNPGQRPGKPKGAFRGGGFRATGPSGGAPGNNGNRAGRRHGRPGGDPQSGTWNRSGQPGGARGPGGQRQGRGGKKRSR
jgi:hypothetical protein